MVEAEQAVTDWRPLGQRWPRKDKSVQKKRQDLESSTERWCQKMHFLTPATTQVGPPPQAPPEWRGTV